MEKQFDGFPQGGLQFLTDIGNNNNKEWFEANRAVYQTVLLEPAQHFVEVIGDQLADLVPAIRYDTRTNGSGSLMRFYRDTRFSKDKTPYKTSLAGMWWLGAGKKTQHPAFGFHLESTGMASMAGLFHFDKDQLKKYRDAVAGRQGEALVAILNQLQAAGYHVPEPEYKRVPKDYPQDHPRGDLLRHKGLHVYPDGIPAGVVTTPALVDAVMGHFSAMSPVFHWLAEVIK